MACGCASGILGLAADPQATGKLFRGGNTRCVGREGCGCVRRVPRLADGAENPLTPPRVLNAHCARREGCDCGCGFWAGSGLARRVLRLDGGDQKDIEAIRGLNTFRYERESCLCLATRATRYGSVPGREERVGGVAGAVRGLNGCYCGVRWCRSVGGRCLRAVSPCLCCYRLFGCVWIRVWLVARGSCALDKAVARASLRQEDLVGETLVCERILCG